MHQALSRCSLRAPAQKPWACMDAFVACHPVRVSSFVARPMDYESTSHATPFRSAVCQQFTLTYFFTCLAMSGGVLHRDVFFGLLCYHEPSFLFTFYQQCLHNRAVLFFAELEGEVGATLYAHSLGIRPMWTPRVGTRSGHLVGRFPSSWCPATSRAFLHSAWVSVTRPPPCLTRAQFSSCSQSLQLGLARSQRLPASASSTMGLS